MILLCSCHKSQTAKQQQQKIDCGCTTDSVININIDSTGWFAYDSSFKEYYIIDSGQYNFRYVYWVCNPELKDVTTIPLSNDTPVEVYYSGKVKLRCPDTLITLPEVFLLNITLDSVRKK